MESGEIVTVVEVCEKDKDYRVTNSKEYCWILEKYAELVETDDYYVKMISKKLISDLEEIIKEQELEIKYLEGQLSVYEKIITLINN